jgi:hypothetical protein
MEGSLRNADRKKTSGQGEINDAESVNVQGISEPERKSASGPLKDEVNPYEVIQPTLSPTPCDLPEHSPVELASVLSCIRYNRKGGKRIRGGELEKLREWLPSALSEYRAEEISSAFSAFLDDDYWRKRKFPTYGFIKQFSQYAPHNGNGRSTAEAGSSAAPEVTPQDLPAGGAVLRPPIEVSLPQLPDLCQRWNEAVPSGPKVVSWSRRDKVIEERMKDPDFLAVADEVFRRCQAIHTVRPADWLNFRWLFQINKDSGSENWYSVSMGKYVWMEHLDEKNGGMSEVDRALAEFTQKLERGEYNASG